MYIVLLLTAIIVYLYDIVNPLVKFKQGASQTDQTKKWSSPTSMVYVNSMDQFNLGKT